MVEKKKNIWFEHVAKVRALPENKGLKQSEIIKKAKQSYKKGE